MKISIVILQIVLIIIFTLVGCKKAEPENVLSITTDDVKLFSEGIYTLNGTIVTIGSEEITAYGFYWSESKDPAPDGGVIQLGTRNSTGSFSWMIHDIQPGKTYYVKAFAVTSSFSCDGGVKSFTTPGNMAHPVFDIEQNIYYPVKIGNQTWLDQNLKVTRYPDGSSIPLVEDQQEWFAFSLYTRAYCWYQNFAAIGSRYGGLYTWSAAMKIDSPDDIRPGNVQGICPDGWHLPSDYEWQQLELFLGMDQSEIELENWRGTDEGGKMKQSGSITWTTPNTGSTNESGFGALAAGWRNGGGYFESLGATTRFWSSSKRGDYAWVRRLDYNSSRIFRSTDGLYNAYSVRCIRDTLPEPPGK